MSRGGQWEQAGQAPNPMTRENNEEDMLTEVTPELSFEG